jgi:phosphatidate cytidylyltransferase
MTFFVCSLVLIDARMDGSLSLSTADDVPIQGTLLCIFLCLVHIPAHLEFADMLKIRGVQIPVTGAVMGSILLSSVGYLSQFEAISFSTVLAGAAFCFFLMIYTNYRKNGYHDILTNCAGGVLAMFYLGFLAGFLMSIRVEFGVWHLLMCVLVIKSSDIGAYTIGRIFGKHKFAPRVSPGKTWEGMLGAVIFAVLVAMIFADKCEIMGRLSAVIFGVCFAFIGQMGDLVESMMKRDAKIKDSSTRVPGFGGILDILDSPLVAAPFAYCYFAANACLCS